ncbi:MAG: hypothetical protein AAB975_01060 [Patescibacteria group bacterium]
MEQLLEHLFESISKVRLLRLFIQNPETNYSFPDLLERTLLKPRNAKKEITKFSKIGLIKAKDVVTKEPRLAPKKPKIKHTTVYQLRPDFPLLEELRALIIKSQVTSRKRLLRSIKHLGKVKLAVISGIFMNSDRARTDLLIVGDDVSKKKLQNFLVQIESEIGKTIRYTLMDTDEYRYRLNMFDRFLRDIMEYPHEKLINKYSTH